MRLIKVFCIGILFGFNSCNKTTKTTLSFEKEIIVETILVDKAKLRLIPEKGQWFYKNKPFNGFAVTYFSNGSIFEKIGYLNGKKHGIAKKKV
jgi:hypothetical protein